MPSDIKRIGSLDIDQDLKAQNQVWRMQRIGWGAIALILVLALAGFLGRGPMSQGEAQTDSGELRVEYSRFLHALTPTVLKIHVAPNVAQNNKVTIHLNHDFLNAVQVKQIMPEPVSWRAGETGTEFVFEIQASDKPSLITMDLEPEKIGSNEARVQIAGLASNSSEVRFKQFTYP